MKIILLFFVLLQVSTPKPTPAPELLRGTTTMVTTSNISANTWASALTTPTMVIHFSGDTILEINGADGKKLKLAANGKVTGDLPHDKAADAFWKAVASVVPKCERERP